MKISNDKDLEVKHIDVTVLQKFFDQNRLATDHKTGELLYLDRTVPDNMVWKPAMEKLIDLQQDADRKNEEHKTDIESLGLQEPEDFDLQ